MTTGASPFSVAELEKESIRDSVVADAELVTMFLMGIVGMFGKRADCKPIFHDDDSLTTPASEPSDSDA